jgi:hypothetical protein
MVLGIKFRQNNRRKTDEKVVGEDANNGQKVVGEDANNGQKS